MKKNMKLVYVLMILVAIGLSGCSSYKNFGSYSNVRNMPMPTASIKSTADKK